MTPPMCSGCSHRSPSTARCPQSRLPPASTHRQLPPMLRTAAAGLCPASLCHVWGPAAYYAGSREGVRPAAHHAGSHGGSNPLPTMPAAARGSDPLPTMPAAMGSGHGAGRGRREKRKNVARPAGEGETYLCSPVLRRERQREEREVRRGSREETAPGWAGGGQDLPQAAAPRGTSNAAGPMPRGWVPGVRGLVCARGPGRCLGACQALTWGSACRAAGAGTSTLAGPWRGSAGCVAQAARGRSGERGTAGDRRAGRERRARGGRCQAQAARWAWPPRGGQEGRRHLCAQRKSWRCRGGAGMGKEPGRAARLRGIKAHERSPRAWGQSTVPSRSRRGASRHAWEGVAGSSRPGPVPGTATEWHSPPQHSRAGEAGRHRAGSSCLQGPPVLPPAPLQAGAEPPPRRQLSGLSHCPPAAKAAGAPARAGGRGCAGTALPGGSAAHILRCSAMLAQRGCGWGCSSARGRVLPAQPPRDLPPGRPGVCRRRRVPVP